MAALAGRKDIGVEINPKWIEIYREVCLRERLEEQTILEGDSRREIEKMVDSGIEVDMILTDVPYWQMDKVTKSKGKYKKVGEEIRENRRSKLTPFNGVSYSTKGQWLEEMQDIFKRAVVLLKPRGFVAVFIGDMYNNGKYHFLTADLALVLDDLDITMKANLTWYDVSKSLHVYGYLYEYIPSLIHQNILVYRKA